MFTNQGQRLKEQSFNFIHLIVISNHDAVKPAFQHMVEQFNLLSIYMKGKIQIVVFVFCLYIYSTSWFETIGRFPSEGIILDERGTF